MERLTTTGDIRAVFTAGRAAHAGTAVVRARDRGDCGPPRVAVAAGRKLGTAVVRNRVKRRLREAARRVELPRGHDLVLVGRSTAADAPFDQLLADLAAAAGRAARGRRACSPGGVGAERRTSGGGRVGP